jgi:hypothetical protein
LVFMRFAVLVGVCLCETWFLSHAWFFKDLHVF